MVSGQWKARSDASLKSIIKFVAIYAKDSVCQETLQAQRDFKFSRIKDRERKFLKIKNSSFLNQLYNYSSFFVRAINIVKKFKYIRKKKKFNITYIFKPLKYWNNLPKNARRLRIVLEVNTCNNNEEIIKVNYIVQYINNIKCK